MCEIYDGQEELPKENFTFKAVITNTAPYFTQNKLNDQKIRFNFTSEYELPKIIDEENMPVTVTFSVFPSLGNDFITLNDSTFLFKPNLWTHL